MTYDLEMISLEIVNRIREILDDFDIEYADYNEHLSMPCPIHGGDNPTGLSILLSDIGNWQCFTHQCHEEYDSSILGFLEALLNTRKPIDRRETIEWAAKFTNAKSVDKKDYNKQKDQTQFMNLYKYISKDKTYVNNFVPRNIVTKSLIIPAPQFENKYSQGILKEYDVGFCNNPDKSMFNRVVVPLYDDTGEYMLGCSGRSIFEKCDKCNRYHDKSTRCPIGKTEKVQAVKWKMSSKFNAETYLYNLWRAKSHIEKDGVIILVEGPGDVWRLEEADIHYGLALLGTKFTDSQKEILEKTNALHLIIATDNDGAGDHSRANIEKKCNRIFNIHHVKLSTDVGDMTIQQVKDLFLPMLKYVQERNHIHG